MATQVRRTPVSTEPSHQIQNRTANGHAPGNGNVAENGNAHRTSNGHTNGVEQTAVPFANGIARTHDGLVALGRRRPPPPRAARTQLLIVDEHPLIRAGVRRLVENEPGLKVAEARSVDHAIEIGHRSAPDVIVMNIDDAGDESIEAMWRIRDGLGPGTTLVAIARRIDDEGVYRVVVSGAAGLVVEPAPRGQLIETIRQAALGNEPISQLLAQRPSVARRVLETYAQLRSSRVVEEPRLTQRQLTILGFVAQGKTNHQIGLSLGVSEHTVKSAISHVLARLGLKHRTEAVVHAVRSGWIDPTIGREKAARDLA